ncbi:MAG: tetratricopeptide repeat protein [Spirochaetota bacterium]
MKRYLLFLLVFFTLSKVILSLDTTRNQAAILNKKGVEALSSNPRKALRYFKKAHALDKSVADYANNIGVVHLKQRQYQKALPFFKTASRINSGYARSYYNQGVCYQALGKNHSAIGAYKKAVRSDSNYVYAYFNLGLVYGRAGNKKQAIANYRKFLKIAPSSLRRPIADAKRRIRELSQ